MQLNRNNLRVFCPVSCVGIVKKQGCFLPKRYMDVLVRGPDTRHRTEGAYPTTNTDYPSSVLSLDPYCAAGREARIACTNALNFPL